MRRRNFVLSLWTPALLLRAQLKAEQTSARGKLITGDPAFLDNGGKQTRLLSNDDIKKVLADDRLNGFDFEALGRPTADSFEIEPFHKRPLYAWQNGKRLHVTYWCDVCYIRTYAPGKCWCCQKDTELDLKETLDE
jgi:hypothetical protein